MGGSSHLLAPVMDLEDSGQICVSFTDFEAWMGRDKIAHHFYYLIAQC